MSKSLPKVLSLFGDESYQSRFPNLSLMTEGSLFAEFLAYELVLPIKKKVNDALNIFERTALLLIRAGYGANLAGVMCIGKELTDFIISRLMSLELLDEHRSLTPLAEEYIEQKRSGDSIEQVKAKIFALRATGDFLPYVSLEREKFLEAVDSGGEITAEIGSRGNSSRITARKIYAKKAFDGSQNMLGQNTIRSVINSYNKICLARGREKLEIAENVMIGVSSPETVYIHLRTAIQNGSVHTLLVSDGFVMNHDAITDHVKNGFPDVMEELRKSVVVIKSGDYGSEQNAVKTGGKYERVVKLLEGISEDSGLVSSVDELKRNSSSRADNIRKLFSSIEQALAYHLRTHPVSNGLKAVLEKQSSFDNEKILSQYAQKLNIVVDNGSVSLIKHLDRSAIEGFSANPDSPVIYTVLPMAIAEGYENHSSAIRDLAVKMPRFMSFLNTLKTYAAAERHGGEAVNIDPENYNKMIKQGFDLIHYILPNLNFDPGHTSLKDPASSEREIASIVAVTEQIGSLTYEKLSETVKKHLIKTSPNMTERLLSIPSETVLSFCVIAENILGDECKSLGIKNGFKQDAVSLVKTLSKEKCPTGLSTVNEINFNKAMNNETSTLGGYTLAFLLKCDEDTAAKFIKNNYHKFIAELAELRAHGNNAGLVLTKEKLISLRNKLYELIKYFGG